jgi:hypothetical protein
MFLFESVKEVENCTFKLRILMRMKIWGLPDLNINATPCNISTNISAQKFETEKKSETIPVTGREGP